MMTIDVTGVKIPLNYELTPVTTDVMLGLLRAVRPRLTPGGRHVLDRPRALRSPRRTRCDRHIERRRGPGAATGHGGQSASTGPRGTRDGSRCPGAGAGRPACGQGAHLRAGALGGSARRAVVPARGRLRPWRSG